MKNTSGYAHIVIVIFISVMAVALVGVAWYFEENKEEIIETTTTTTNTTSANVNVNTTNTNSTITNTTNTNVNTSVNTNTVDDNQDEQGCDASKGYGWCESQQRCVYRGQGCISVEEASKHYRKIAEQDGFYTYELVSLGFQFSYPTALGEIVGIYFDDDQPADLLGMYISLQPNHFKNYQTYTGAIPTFSATTKDYQIYEAPRQSQALWQEGESANEYCNEVAEKVDAHTGCIQFGSRTDIYYLDYAVYHEQGMMGSGTSIGYTRTYYIESNSTDYAGIESNVGLGTIDNDEYVNMELSEVQSIASSQINDMVTAKNDTIQYHEEIINTIEIL